MTTRNWREVRQVADLDEAQVDAHRAAMVEQVRVHQLKEARAKRALTQRDVAAAMGVTQARVSQIEHGRLARNEVDTLRAYVEAIGGKLELVADFGAERITLT